ncbi:MAG TPA: glycosyltransferase family 39 protein [Sphingomicrobium sp.]|nr:glycosyltransferase family 39 protein [Sphingomicrobium sp.]
METKRRERLWWAAVSATALAGLVLRVVAAQGGLWTDEAWSMIYAAKARNPMGVFLRINHDNNHHLNSLWLQAIGPGASPLLARVPAIAAGTLCILVAASLCRRCSRKAGMVAALLFAVAPTFVAFGSEARGYAMMLLAALLMFLLVAVVLEGRPARGARWWLAALAVFGMFSHLTMAAPVAIVTTWLYLERRTTLGPRLALFGTFRLMGPALAATIGVILFVFVAATMSPTGMRVGGIEPFSSELFVAALDDLALWSAGFRSSLPWLVPLGAGAAALLVMVRPPDWAGPRTRLYAMLVLTVPIGLAMLRASNSGYARYYLMSGVGLLLMMSEWIARGLEGRPAVRAAAGLLIVTLMGASLWRDSLLVRADRGRPEIPVRDMASLSPSGASVAFAEPRLKAVVAVAAERIGYRARFAGGCAPADFLLAAQSRRSHWAASVQRCGIEMDAIDSSVAIPLGGDSWVLYRAKTLQSFGSADSGRAPAAKDRRFSGRAGVAQG